MSGTIIRDGTGKGYAMQVDDHGRAYVNSTSVSHFSHHSSYHKNAYITSAACHLNSTSKEAVMFFKNSSSDKDVELYWAYISCNENSEFYVYIGSKYDSGGVPLTAKNLYVGEAVPEFFTIYEGLKTDVLTLDDSLEEKIQELFLPAYGSMYMPLEGAVIVPAGKTISVYAKGPVDAAAIFTLGFTTHEAGTKL